MKDERYRVWQGQPEISEALWHACQEYGNSLAVDERVAVARHLERALRGRAGPLTRSDVLGAFERFGIRRPPNGYWRTVRDRLERLDAGAER